MDRPDELIGLSKAAKLLGVSPDTLRAWLRQGRIPAVQYGPRGLYRIRRADVLAYREASWLHVDGERDDTGAAPVADAGKSIGKH